MDIFTSGLAIEKKVEFLKTNLINLRATSANHYLLGELSLILNKEEEAYKNFIKSAEINPNNVDAKVQITKILFAQKDFETAKKYIVDILVLDSENLEAHKLLGWWIITPHIYLLIHSYLCL